jgi:hypothetical protein
VLFFEIFLFGFRRRNSELTDELKDLSLQVQGCLSEVNSNTKISFLNLDTIMNCLKISLHGCFRVV